MIKLSHQLESLTLKFIFMAQVVSDKKIYIDWLFDMYIIQNDPNFSIQILLKIGIL